MLRLIPGLLAVALLAAGCGTGGRATAKADTQNGQKLFTSTCGACHALAAAGTNGTVGPDLDAAFRGARQSHFKQSTIENVVLDMIRLGSGPVAGGPSMPSRLFSGQNADDVAAYVASVAGLGSSTAKPPSQLGTDGKAIFKAECSNCHTLKAAAATGTVGPNLDQLKPAEARVVQQVTNGGAIMPAFKGKLSTAQIEAVAKFVASSAGK